MRHRLAAMFIALTVTVLGACAGPRANHTETNDDDDAPTRAVVIVFHHALGRTPGVEAFADALRATGRRVVVPDLFEGRTFETIDDGVAHVEAIGFETIIERGVAAAAAVEGPIVVVGFSLGVLPAQKLAETRAGVRGAVLCFSAVPIETFAPAWPDGVAVQIHMIENDPWAGEDLDAARSIAAAVPGDLFTYPGPKHLVIETSHEDDDPAIAALILDRTLGFVRSLD